MCIAEMRRSNPFPLFIAEAYSVCIVLPDSALVISCLVQTDAPKAKPPHFNHSGKFKILQIADLHYSVSQGTCLQTKHEPCKYGDVETDKSLLSIALDAEKPDLVVFTGDQLNGQGTSWDSKSVLAKFAATVIDRNISWAAVFGNHDSEEDLSRTEEMQYLEALPYSLSKAGPAEVHGVGNYLLKVLSPDPSVLFSSILSYEQC